MHAGNSLQKTFLIDGPLMTTIERRKHVIERMANDLIEAGALASDQEAVRLLSNRGYSLFDVALLAGEARMVAYQEIVAAEMEDKS
jgi:hypothetical protein